MDIADFIDARLDAMLAHPRQWGDPESFELLALLLLELRQVVLSAEPVSQSQSLRSHLDTYSTFLRQRHPELGARPLSAISEDLELIARSLRDFQIATDAAQHAGAHAASLVPLAPKTLGSDVEVNNPTPTKPREEEAA
jgi:hypothetical protein